VPLRLYNLKACLGESTGGRNPSQRQFQWFASHQPVPPLRVALGGALRGARSGHRGQEQKYGEYDEVDRTLKDRRAPGGKGYRADEEREYEQ
jgi:hypothetical protein